MIIQAVVAVFAGVAFFIKSNWQKIRGIKDQESGDQAHDQVDNIEPTSGEDDVNKAS